MALLQRECQDYKDKFAQNDFEEAEHASKHNSNKPTVDVWLNAFKGRLPKVFNESKCLTLSAFSGAEPIERVDMAMSDYIGWVCGIQAIADAILKENAEFVRVSGMCPLYLAFNMGWILQRKAKNLHFINITKPREENEDFTFRFEEKASKGCMKFVAAVKNEQEGGHYTVVYICMKEEDRKYAEEVKEQSRKDGLSVGYTYIIQLDEKHVPAISEDNFAAFHHGAQNALEELEKWFKSVGIEKIALVIYGSGFLAMMVGFHLKQNVFREILFYDTFPTGTRYRCVNKSE